jgi:alkylation response protein AidB-like acyl-CoA dehydrogenase
MNLADDTLLTRVDAAAALTEAGFPVSPATLATKATRGGGPPYRLFGRKPLYEWGPTLGWAKERLSAPVSNTSEARAAQ